MECAQYFLDEISKVRMFSHYKGDGHYLEYFLQKEPREPIYLYEPVPMGPEHGFGGERGGEGFPPRGGGRGGARGGHRGRGSPGRGGVSEWSGLVCVVAEVIELCNVSV